MEQTKTVQGYVQSNARIVLCGILFLLTCLVWVVYVYTTRHTSSVMRVTFLDVGQGDSIFIESPTGVQVLIDGGPDRAVLRELSNELGFWDRSIDMVLATHEDKDHVAGLVDVFEKYNVATFIRTENQGESGAADLVDVRAEEEGSEVVYARRGMQFDLGGGALFTILFPDRDPSFLESNTSSIVARLTYGDTEFLFTGDSPQAIEHYLVDLDAASLSSDVLKLGHHGSRTSSSAEFLDAVHPTYAIVSAEKNSRYGHPHKEVVDAVAARHIQMVSTAEEGSIAFETDGATLSYTQ